MDAESQKDIRSQHSGILDTKPHTEFKVGEQWMRGVVKGFVWVVANPDEDRAGSYLCGDCLELQYIDLSGNVDCCRIWQRAT